MTHQIRECSMFARSFDGPSCSVNRDVGTDILTRVSMLPMLDIQMANSNRYSPKDKLQSDSRAMQPRMRAFENEKI